MSRVAAVAVLAAAFLAAPGLGAYLKLGTDVGDRIVGIRWNRQPVRYFVTDREVPGVPVGALQAAVARAFATWSGAAGASVSAEFVGVTPVAPSEADTLSVIGFEARPDRERILGSTSFTTDDATGEILEADIFFNSTFNWSVAEAGEPGRHDLESIAVHEIGHLFGLGHSALGETDVVASGGRRVSAKRAVMFPIAYPAGTTRDRAIEADDAAGLSDIYPAAGSSLDVGSIGGRVTKNGAGVFGAHVTAVNLGTGALHATFSLSAGGDFVLGRLPPGVYLVRAEPLDDAELESFFEEDAGVDADFIPAYAPRLGVVPAGGSGERLEIVVRAK
jgi:hypothetical protein